MSASEISLFCPGKADFQTQDGSCNSRVIVVAIGIIFLIGAALILSKSLGPASQPPDWVGYASGIVGLVVLAVGCCVRLQRAATENRQGKGYYLDDDDTPTQSPELKRQNQDPIPPLNLNVPRVPSKEDIIIHAARGHFFAKNYDQALEDVKKVVHKTKEKEVLIARIADAYFVAGDYVNALQVIKEIVHDSKIKEERIYQIATAYFIAKDYVNALQVIKQIVHDTATKEALILKIASAHFTAADYVNALQVVKEVIHDTASKEALILQIAIAHSSERDYDKALQVIKEITHDVGTKETMILNIVTAYFTARDYTKALQAVKAVVHAKMQKEARFLELMQAFYDANDEVTVKDIIYEIVSILLSNKLRENNRRVDVSKVEQHRNFGRNLANSLYQQVATCLQDKRTDRAKAAIEEGVEANKAALLAL